MSSDRIACFAGLFDGEGCVGVYHQPKERSSCLRVQVVQNLRPGVVDAFSQLVTAFGGKVRYQKTRTANTKVTYDAAGGAACAFLLAILPFVDWKQEQAALGIAWHTQRLPRRRNGQGRVVARDEAEMLLAVTVAEISSALKIMTLAEVRRAREDWALAIERLRLPEVLAHHQSPD
jgi:hypothetical protein